MIHIREGDTVKIDSLCCLSNDLAHDTSFVWALQREVCNYIKSNYPQVKKIEYFSDGCGGQYTNFKNFLNLAYHLEDFGLIAIWIFFASCHGKSNCDGVGAATKRKLRNQSLTVGPQDAILSSQSAYNFLINAMPSVTFFHIDKESIQDDKKKHEQRYTRAKTVNGTRSFHHFSSSAISLCLLGFILIRTFQSAVILHAHMTAIGGLVSWNVLKMQMLRSGMDLGHAFFGLKSHF